MYVLRSAYTYSYAVLYIYVGICIYLLYIYIYVDAVGLHSYLLHEMLAIGRDVGYQAGLSESDEISYNCKYCSTM